MTARLINIAPYLLVTDLRRAVAYFEQQLGFTVPMLWRDPPIFAIAQRDDLRIMLAKAAEHETVSPIGLGEDRLDAYIWITDAAALFAEMKQRGAEIAFDLVDQQEYGQREFAVRTPDGHVIIFAQPIS